MKSLLKLVGILIVAAAIGAAGIYFTGNTMNVMIAVLKPSGDFDAALQPPAPDYADDINWAALPQTDDLADLVPEGIEPRAAFAPVDVFFIHPTGYMGRGSWTSPMDPDSATEENTKWMMTNQASVYNSCCNVFAPRYREATIFSYMSDPETRDAALGFAYKDVERAFDQFLGERNDGRPFIIASHSQGTHHGATLLQKRIAGTPLRDQMIAAYIIGGGITHEEVAAMSDIEVCDSPSDLSCVIHWATLGEGGSGESWREGAQICTNPLSWKSEGARAPAKLSRGAVASSGEFNISFFGNGEAEGVTFGPLGKPHPEHTWAECKDGFLFVADQSDGMLGGIAGMGDKNYHGLDYPLFHMDIRENTVERVEAYFSKDDK